MNNWQIRHGEVIAEFLRYLNGTSDGDYILKGGTALSQCYGLNRFSEDIDLDGKANSILEIIAKFCARNNYSFRIAKDTDTVKRAMIHYGNEQKPLKVETSYCRTHIPESDITQIKNIAVYKIEQLCIMKTSAYAARDKIRDLFDLSFIVNNYYDELSDTTKFVVQNAVGQKGVEQFDYLVSVEGDELVDPDRLADAFLAMYDKLDLLRNKEESQTGDALDDTQQLQQTPIQNFQPRQVSRPVTPDTVAADASEQAQAINAAVPTRKHNNRSL